MESTDEQLILEVAGGDLSSLRTLYDRYKRRIMTYAYYTVGSRDRAEDVLQETFIRVFRHAKRFTPGKRFSPWVHAIAANLCRDANRKKRRRSRAITTTPLEQIVPYVSDGSPSPRRSAAGREFIRRLREEINGLPLQQREVLVLHYIQGMKYREIAHVLGCPIGTVQSRLHAGLKAVRERLKEFFD